MQAKMDTASGGESCKRSMKISNKFQLSTTLPRTSCGAILRRVLAEAASLSMDALPTSVAN